jgi:hypothetical protein
MSLRHTTSNTTNILLVVLSFISVIYSLPLQELRAMLIRHQLIFLQHSCCSIVATSRTSKQLLTLQWKRRAQESNSHRKVSITRGSTSLLQYFHHCIESIDWASKHHSGDFDVQREPQEIPVIVQLVSSPPEHNALHSSNPQQPTPGAVAIVNCSLDDPFLLRYRRSSYLLFLSL